MPRRRAVPARVEAAALALGLGGIPPLIREHGRARGFERLRDLVLEHPDAFGTPNLLPVLKLVIELDRHALFGQLSEAKAREAGTREAWEKFQQYLRAEDVTAAAPQGPQRRRRAQVRIVDAEPTGDHEVDRVARGALPGADPSWGGSPGSGPADAVPPGGARDDAVTDAEA